MTIEEWRWLWRSVMTLGKKAAAHRPGPWFPSVMNPAIMKTATLSLALLLSLHAFAEDEPGQPMPATSPDGRFVFRQLDESEQAKLGADPQSVPGVFDAKTRKRLFTIPDDMYNSFTEAIRVVWSKDSTRLAFNFRAGGRYYTTALYKLDGTKFIEIPSPEETLSALPAREKIVQIKAMGLKADAHQRRIHDECTTRRWLDGNTIEVDARSESTVLLSQTDENDIDGVSGAFRCTAKFDPKTKKWKILKSEKLKNE